ncbi:MAG TPA: hypothetical protein VIK78_00015 [Ruminiclostridium sp.]
MKDFIVLKFLDRFKRIFEKLGVDYAVMRRILQVKLIMDSRRVPTIMKNSSSKNTGMEDKKSSFNMSLLMYGLIGLMLVSLVLIGSNFIYQMSFVFGILIFMLMTSLISDFSSVLLDIRDKNIIFSKPVKSITLSMAKAIHILIYMFTITFSLTGIALIASLVKYGIIFFIMFLAEIILVDLFIVVLTALLYLFILRFFDGEKLKDIINYVQIILSITIAIGYQLLARLFSFVNLNMVFTPKWWQYFIVPLWFGAPFELIIHRNYKFTFLLLSILGVIVPIISIVVYLKLIPFFEENLQKLNNNSEQKKENKRFVNVISSIVCRTKSENAFFRFSCAMMKSEREFKLKVYPSLGFSLIFPFIFLFSDITGKGFTGIASSKMYLTIYFCALMLPTVIMMMKYSGNYKGAWIYKVAPIKDTSDIYKGVFKAFIVKLVAPVFTLESLIFIVIFGIRIVPDLILVFLNMTLYIVICFRAFRKALPFSEAFGTAQQSEGLIIIPIMFLLGGLALLHFIATLFTFGVLIYIIIALLVNAVAWKKAFNIIL